MSKEGKKKANDHKMDLGMAGALIGGMVGAFIWLILFKKGEFPAIAGLLTVMGTFGGMKILGEKFHYGTIAISTCISIMIVYLAHNVSWAWYFYTILSKHTKVSFVSVYLDSASIMVETGDYFYYWKDLIIGQILVVSYAAVVLIYYQKGRKKISGNVE